MGSASSRIEESLKEIRGVKSTGKWRPTLSAFNALVTAEQLTAQSSGASAGGADAAAVIDCKDAKVLKTVLALLGDVLAGEGVDEADVRVVLETAIRLTFLQGLYKALGKASHAPIVQCVRFLAVMQSPPAAAMTVHLALYLVQCIVRCPFSSAPAKTLAKMERAAREQFDAAQGYAALAELLAASCVWRPRHVSFGVALRRPLHLHAALLNIFCASFDACDAAGGGTGGAVSSSTADAAARQLALLREQPGCFAVLLELSRVPSVEVRQRSGALLIRTLLAATPARITPLQNAVRTSGALLWHLRRATADEGEASGDSRAASPASGAASARSLSPRPSSPASPSAPRAPGSTAASRRAALRRSRDLVEIFCCNNEASSAVVSATLPTVLFSRLRGAPVPGIQRFAASVDTRSDGVDEGGGAKSAAKTKAVAADSVHARWFSSGGGGRERGAGGRARTLSKR